jgi:serine/threonine protein kinase
MELIGQRIRHLRIEERLGQGGMGEVYLARDQVLDRLVAVKTLRAEQKLSEEGKARFLREARLLSKLGDPGICQIYELVETPEADYLVLEYVRGRTLRAAGPELSLEQKLALLAKVARALAFAHRAGIVHRDLKADNVMVTPEGEIKILDFGVARSLEETPPPAPAAAAGKPPAGPTGAETRPLGLETRPGVLHQLGGEATEHAKRPDVLGLPPSEATSSFAWPGETAVTPGSVGITQVGSVVGTLAAMSPEQAAGATLTEASDLYSFGILMQELLTGKPAYGELRGMAVWQKVLRGETVPVKGFDPDLLELLKQLLALDPLKRPGAELVAERLRWIAEKPERERRRRRKRLLVSAAFLVLAIGLAFTLYLALAARRARDQAERRRQVAEDLIGFMLGDLSAKLGEVGRLDVLNTVGERAQAYFAALPEGELTAEELGWRLQGLQQIANVYLLKSEVERSRAVLEQAARMAERDAARFAGELGIAVAAFDVYSTQGQIAYDLGELDEAIGLWGKCLERAEAIRRTWPEEPESQWVLATAHHNLATALEQHGRRAEAIEHLRQAIVEEDALIAGGGEIVAETRGLRSATRGFLSRALERQGELEAALQVRRLYLEELEKGGAAEPENAEIQYDLAVARGFVANLATVLGQFEAADRLYRSGSEAMAKLAKADPENGRLGLFMTRFHSTPAELRQALGQPDAALEGLDAAQEVLDRLQEGKPEVPDLIEAQALIFLRRGLLDEEKLPAKALSDAGLAAVAFAKLLPHVDGGQRAAIANADLLRGRLLGRLGRPAEAAKAFAAAEATLAPLERPLTATALLEAELEIDFYQGREGQARETFAKLDAMGWKAPRRPRLERLLEISPEEKDDG